MHIKNQKYRVFHLRTITRESRVTWTLHNITKSFWYYNIFFLLIAYANLIISVIKYKRKTVIESYKSRTKKNFAMLRHLYLRTTEILRFQRHKINRCPLHSIENSLRSCFVNIAILILVTKEYYIIRCSDMPFEPELVPQFYINTSI